MAWDHSKHFTLVKNLQFGVIQDNTYTLVAIELVHFLN